MIKTLKIAISLPREDFEKIEKIRKRGKLHRSAVIHKAICHYFNDLEEIDLIKKYESGYRNKPEDKDEIAALELISFDAIKEEEDLK